MEDLFDRMNLPPVTYPEVPGSTNDSTSKEAADAIAGSAKSLRALALKEIKYAWSPGLTTDELALRMGVDRGSVQPRTSELKALGLIRDSGQRRRNANCKRVIVWVAA